MTKEEIAIAIGNHIKCSFKKLQEKWNRSNCCSMCGQKLPNPYTQAWLADQIGVSKATLCHILQGNRLPTLEQIVMLAVLFDCTVDDLLEEAKPLFIMKNLK